MKPTKTKAEVRREIGQQIRDYLAHGGQVEELEPGASGRDINQALPVNFSQPKTTRTPLLEEIQAVDARKNKAPQKKHPAKKPARILIRDDFGEPVRWVWQEE